MSSARTITQAPASSRWLVLRVRGFCQVQGHFQVWGQRPRAPSTVEAWALEAMRVKPEALPTQALKRPPSACETLGPGEYSTRASSASAVARRTRGLVTRLPLIGPGLLACGAGWRTEGGIQIGLGGSAWGRAGPPCTVPGSRMSSKSATPLLAITLHLSAHPPPSSTQILPMGGIAGGPV